MTCACARRRGLAIDRKAINQALTLGYSHVTRQHRPGQLRILLEAAGAGLRPGQGEGSCWPTRAIPSGFDAGNYNCDISYANLGEAVQQTWARSASAPGCGRWSAPAFNKGYSDKKFKNIIQAGRGAFGNAATRLEAFIVKGGAYAYGSYPTSTRSTSSRRRSSTTRSARRSCIKMQQMMLRAGDLRADLAACLHQRRGPTGGRVELRPHPRFPVHRALRGPHVEERMTEDER